MVDYLVKPVNLEQMELCFRPYYAGGGGLFVENLILREEVERKERLMALNNELLARVDELNLLNRIMEDFDRLDSSQWIFNKVVDLGMDVLKADFVGFYIYIEHDSSFVSIAENAHDGESPLPMTDGLGSFFADIIQDDTPCLIIRNTGENGIDASIQSFMAVPVKIREKTFGVVSAALTTNTRRFTEKDIYYLNFIAQKAASAIESIALYENIYDNLFATLYAFVASAGGKGFLYKNALYTRVAEVAHRIGREMDCTDEELDVINFAGHLHDIGKIGIDDQILNKPARLTEEEYEKIKAHPAIGADIVGQLGLWEKEKVIIRHHHEFYDGRGYPDGLAGEEIPFLARIMSVADAFDAMASDRAYRKKMDKSKVVAIITECSGTQFDPVVVQAFLKVVDEVWPHDD